MCSPTCPLPSSADASRGSGSPSRLHQSCYMSNCFLRSLGHEPLLAGKCGLPLSVVDRLPKIPSLERKIISAYPASVAAEHSGFTHHSTQPCHRSSNPMPRSTLRSHVHPMSPYPPACLNHRLHWVQWPASRCSGSSRAEHLWAHHTALPCDLTSPCSGRVPTGC